ncbi:unnamed protein product [Prorocentrum cordatum]|uniref:Uncharacterized protein n=1 Tax=Prorocentrum cordatum TaxID=2364126 RepID=A0ABN9VIE2_9DINO|nr:unnamed protein product [Polarella glacialis]
MAAPALVQAGLFVALLASTVGQRLAFKGVGYCLGPYPTFVLLSVSGAFVAIFGAICTAIVVTTGGFQPETRTWSCFSAFAAIGVCNGLQGSGMIFANPRVPGLMQVLLQQAIIPFTLAIARVVCAAAFSPKPVVPPLRGTARASWPALPCSSCPRRSWAALLAPTAARPRLAGRRGAGEARGLGAEPRRPVGRAVPAGAAARGRRGGAPGEGVLGRARERVPHTPHDVLGLLLPVPGPVASSALVPLGAPSLAGLAAELAEAWRLCRSEPGAGLVLSACVLLMLLAQLSQVLDFVDKWINNMQLSNVCRTGHKIAQRNKGKAENDGPHANAIWNLAAGRWSTEQQVDQGARHVKDSGRIIVKVLGSMQFQDPELQKEYWAELEDAGGRGAEKKDQAALRTP